jgi:hypothetical protein
MTTWFAKLMELLLGLDCTYTCADLVVDGREAREAAEVSEAAYVERAREAAGESQRGAPSYVDER